MYAKPPKINERSESFNENRLVTQLTKECENITSAKEPTEFFNYRRDSCNEKYLRNMRNEGNDKFKNVNEMTSEEAGSPFVSMPAIPAVYLAENGESQPLEKVNFPSFHFYKKADPKYYILKNNLNIHHEQFYVLHMNINIFIHHHNSVSNVVV